MRPLDFAKELVENLNIYSKDVAEETVRKIEGSILSQIITHIEKNTTFTRIRLNRREEDLVTNQLICINCDSALIANADYCAHCCFQYDRKPGAITGGISAGVGGAVVAGAAGGAGTVVSASAEKGHSNVKDWMSLPGENKAELTSSGKGKNTPAESKEGWKRRS